MRNESIFWGVGLVLLGGLLMAQNLNLLPPNINVWSLFWPLALMIVGARMLLRSTHYGSLKQEALRLPLDGAQSARVNFYYGAGELRIDDQAGLDELLSGSFGGGVEQRVERAASETVVDLRVPVQNIPIMGPLDAPHGLNWTVGLNRNIPLSLNLELGASHNQINLRNLYVRDLRLQTGASATEIEFPAQGQTRATVKSGAASVDVRIPQGVAARIHTSGGMASFDIDSSRFARLGSEYRSPDYDTAENRLDLDIETGMGSVTVR